MNSKFRAATLFPLMIVMASGVAFAQRQGRLLGKVVDTKKNPIEGVVVTVTAAELPSFRVTETTNKKGIFIVDFSHLGITYHYRFDKAGYQTLEAEQMWDFVGTNRFEWTMIEGNVAAPGGVTPTSASLPAVTAYNEAVAAIKVKDYATAEAKLVEAVGSDPNLMQAWAVLSTVRVQIGHNQAAVEAAEKAMSLGSTDETVLMSRWQAYRNLNDEAKAAQALADLEKYGRQTEEAKRIHNEGVALMKAGDDAGAFAKFQEALKLDPNLQSSLLGLATAGLKLGHNAEAATAAETILKSDPNNEKALRVRYNACLALADKARLASALVGLGAVEPVIARDGLLRLAFDAYDANDMPQARDRFTKVLALDPNQPQAHYYLGLVLVSQGETEAAKSHLQRFLEIAPNDTEANSAREMLTFLSKR